MKRRLINILFITLFIVNSANLPAASLPQNPMGSTDYGYNEGYGNKSTDPLLQRVINIDSIANGFGGWTMTTQGTAPYEYWTHSAYANGFQVGDTLRMQSGAGYDSISLWASDPSFPGYLQSLEIWDEGNDNPMGSTGYFEEEIVPIEDGTLPLLIFITLYCLYSITKKKATE